MCLIINFHLSVMYQTHDVPNYWTYWLLARLWEDVFEFYEIIMRIKKEREVEEDMIHSSNQGKNMFVEKEMYSNELSELSS